MADDPRIDALTDQQALSILDSLAGELASDDTPEGSSAQQEALGALFGQESENVELDRAVDADPVAAAAAARSLLRMYLDVPEIRPSLDEWLDNPPTQEAAAIPLILAAPVVLAGCIALLNVAGHVKFKRYRDGTWSVSYDPSKRTPFDATLKETISTMAGLMKALIPGAA